LIPIFNKIQVPLTVDVEVPQRRIWWYPTGALTFIPIHAAGHGGVDVSRLVISSYLTTLGSLFQAQKQSRQDAVGQLQFLAVSQPNTPGQRSLPLSKEEVNNVVTAACSTGWPEEDITHLCGADATVDQVLTALDTCSWVHFACHGFQHPTSGMESGLALHDGPLDLGQIASKRLSSGKFAFLSVCHAASGLKDLPGEAIHLAAGFQFAGFQSVIATMWSIRDEDAPKVAEQVYQYLFRDGSHSCDLSDAATALNHAILRLRDDPEVTLERWVPFVHFGV